MRTERCADIVVGEASLLDAWGDKLWDWGGIIRSLDGSLAWGRGRATSD